MSHEKETMQVFVLEEYDRGEHDRVFKVFARENGVFFVLGKSIRLVKSKMRFHMQKGRTVTITVVKGKDIYRLVGVSGSVRSSHTRTICAFLARFMRGETPEQYLFDHMMTLTHSNTEASSLNGIVVAFIVLTELGFADVEHAGFSSFEDYRESSVSHIETMIALQKERVTSHIKEVALYTHL